MGCTPAEFSLASSDRGGLGPGTVALATVPGTGTLADKKLDNGSVLTKIQHFLSYIYIAVPDVSRLTIQERPVL